MIKQQFIKKLSLYIKNISFNEKDNNNSVDTEITIKDIGKFLMHEDQDDKQVYIVSLCGHYRCQH